MKEKDFERRNLNLIEELRLQGIRDERILEAMRNVPRHLFVPESLLEEAYHNCALPIGYSQTISQPYTVAFMIEALEVRPGQKILEIGTGSGWNAALLGWILGKKGKLFSTELVSALAIKSVENIARVGIRNVEVICWDGSRGYEKEAPYERIIVTAACSEIPKPLIEQLDDKGIIVAPVGSWYCQKMTKLTKNKNRTETAILGDFVFVPLKGEYGASW